jgi:hypothetical protein
MKTLLTILFVTLCAATSYGQTIKTLGYNTNGQVVYSGASQLTFTNPIALLSSNRSTVSSILFLDNTGIEFDGEGFATNFPAIYFVDSERAAATRTNLGLPLPALTNTSNVTMMRALSGSTNASHPFSGSFVFVDDANNTWSATVSNGIIQSIVEQ